MKTVVSLTLIVLGTTLLALPLFLTFILQALGGSTGFASGHFTEGQQVACWVPGGIMLILGILSAFIGGRSAGSPPK